MERTLKKVIEELLDRTEVLQKERDEAISRCQANCKLCQSEDCPHRVFIKARAPMHVVFGKR
jgi:hypothetical protein